MNHIPAMGAAYHPDFNISFQNNCPGNLTRAICIYSPGKIKASSMIQELTSFMHEPSSFIHEPTSFIEQAMKCSNE